MFAVEQMTAHIYLPSRKERHKMKTKKVERVYRQRLDPATEYLMLVVCLLVGLVMTSLYTYFAGGDANHLHITTFVLPIASVILYILYYMYKIGWFFSAEPFWIFLVYCLLPIWVNGISIVLKWVGLSMVGDFIFRYRYASLIAVPLSLVIGLVASAFAKAIWRCRPGGRARPPSK